MIHMHDLRKNVSSMKNKMKGARNYTSSSPVTPYVSRSKQHHQGGARSDKAHEAHNSPSSGNKATFGPNAFQGMRTVQQAINTVNSIPERNPPWSQNRGRKLAKNTPNDYWQMSFPESRTQNARPVICV